MDTYVEDQDVLFRDVFAHLATVDAEPATKILDEDLLKRAERALSGSTPRKLLWQLLSVGEALLQVLQQDPRFLTRLLESVVLLIPFDELRTNISSDKLEEGLRSPSVPVQLLCLAYLKKASSLPSGASFVAISPSLVNTLVTVWLSSESTEVAERSIEVIISLLAVDSPETVTFVTSQDASGGAEGQGLLWRRIFHDAQVYELLFAWTSLKKSKHNLTTKKGSHAATISQARLFDFVAQAATLNWTAIMTSTFPNVEKEYSKDASPSATPYGGLLKYTASGMIDATDILMELLRQDFFMKLLQAVEENSNKRGVTPGLIAAIQQDAGVTEPEQPSSGGVHLPDRTTRR